MLKLLHLDFPLSLLLFSFDFQDVKFHLEEKLGDLESTLDPGSFFRSNRQFILQRSAITSLQAYFNGRLIVNTQPIFDEQIIVSKANASILKAWLNDTRSRASYRKKFQY